MSEALLTVINLNVTFGGLGALCGLSFSFKSGQILGIVGPNGSGKTTLLDCICGLRRPNSGSIQLNGVELIGKAPQLISHMGVARTFQTTRLFDSLTAIENLLVVQRPTGSLLRRIFAAVSAADAQAVWIANPIASTVFRSAPKEVGSLPYGDRRLLELVRAVETSPSILLLDEPSASMNQAEATVLLKALNQLRDRCQMGIVLVDHNVPFVRDACDRLLVLDAGRIIAQGEPTAVLADPKVVDVYLGSASC
jgi:ABC-type branched-subunit amino acid transport system ATPase component